MGSAHGAPPRLARVLQNALLAWLQLQWAYGARSERATPRAEQDWKDGTRVTLQYGPYGGLFNQHQQHAIALVLAQELQVDVLEWPPNRGRATFDESQGDSWTHTDVDTRYDTDYISQYAAERNIQIKFAPGKDYHPPRDDHIEICTEDRTPTGIAIPIGVGVLHGSHTAADFASHLKQKISELRNDNPSFKDNPIRVVARVLFGSIKKKEFLPTIKHLHFAPCFKKSAAEVVSGMHRMFGMSEFNGIHLRVEQDVSPIAKSAGGWANLWSLYREQLVSARLDTAQPMYMASGLIHASRTSAKELARLIYFVGELTGEFTRQVVFKDLFLPSHALANLTADDQAIIDFEVLRYADKVVTLHFSSFSKNLGQYRGSVGKLKKDTLAVRVDSRNTAKREFAGKNNTLIL